jgi:hypothetical protein
MCTNNNTSTTKGNPVQNAQDIAMEIAMEQITGTLQENCSVWLNQILGGLVQHATTRAGVADGVAGLPVRSLQKIAVRGLCNAIAGWADATASHDLEDLF